MSFTKFPSNAKATPAPFKISSSGRSSGLRLAKVAPATYESSRSDRKFGVTTEWIKNAKAEWESFDWRSVETRVNALPQYLASITDTDGTIYEMHFFALFSEKPDAVPIVMLHGAFMEFETILNILSTRYTPATLPYHVVVPSLPGHAISSPPPLDREFQLQDVARLVNTLMVQLGFDEYVVQGGDIGSQTARILVCEHANCRAIHMNFCHMIAPANFDVSVLNEKDRAAAARSDEFVRFGASYAFEQATRLSTIGFVLASSPLALLKFMDWTDEDPSMATILEFVSLYWFTDTTARSFYPYRQTTPANVNHVNINTNPNWHITKPFGFPSFPKEILPSPRAWIEGTGSLAFYREHDKGGHFAALEHPETLLKDVEDFVARVARMQ
ncbi:Alpha/Beta hydrolase protein [Mycena maculata]|uniref:Alpha/Beta hydrolase protein n=1 Tax=Mycena maculata TaxID=230809 RepID=A0AAD7KAL5_9AGAR|nr:Alpha/Beta hydrolase protein [Mycena maculata]